MSPVVSKDQTNEATQECKDMVVELEALRAWKENAIKEHKATVQALERTIAKHLGDMEELKREAQEEAARHAKKEEGLKSQVEKQEWDILKNKAEMRELEDMVIWSETTMATKVDELKGRVEAKDAEISRLEMELESVGRRNDAQATEIEALKSWKEGAKADLEELNQRSILASEENREWKGKLVTTEDRLQAKTVECKALMEKLANETAQLTEARSQLQSKETECCNLQQHLEEHLNESETTIAGLMEDIAKDATIYSEKITQLESDLAAKTAECDKLSHEVFNYKGHLTEASNELSEMCTKLHARKMEISELKSRVEESDVKYERTLEAMTKNNAKETEVYSERIAVLEDEVSSRDIKLDELQKTLDETRNDLQTQLQTKETDCSNLQKQLDESLKNLADMCGDVATMEANLKSTIITIDESQMMVDMLKNELSRCQSELEAEKESNGQMAQELTAYKGSFQEKQARIDECESDIDALKQMNSEYQGVIESEIERARMLAQQLEESKEGCDAMALQISGHETTIDAMREEIDALRAGVESKTKKTCLLTQELADKNERISASQAQVLGLESQVSDSERTIAAMEADVPDLKKTVELRDGSIASLEHSLNAKNAEISELRVELSTTHQNIERLEGLLQECKEEFKNQLMTERSTRVEATRHLKSTLVEKEKEIKQHKEGIKSASTKVTSMESKIVSLQVINDTLVVERDELRQWKREVEVEIQRKDFQLDELTSQTDALRKHCHKLGHLLQQRDADSKTFGQKLDFEARASQKLSSGKIEMTKEIKCMKETLQLKSTKIDELKRKIAIIEPLEATKTNAKTKMALDDDEISILIMTNTQLSKRVDELGKDMERQVAKYKMAQQAIAGLEKTLLVSTDSQFAF
jgi:chromosome segregation ATPase